MNVLLIEDNHDQALLFKLQLERVPGEFSLTHCCDGESALEYLQCSKLTNLDVVFLDLRLPKVDGLEVLSRMREFPETFQKPVVILTSSALASDEQKANQFNIMDYIIKPATFEQLTHIFRKLNSERFA